MATHMSVRFYHFGKKAGSILAYSCGLLNLCRNKEPAFFGAQLRAAHFFILPKIGKWEEKSIYDTQSGYLLIAWEVLMQAVQ